MADKGDYDPYENRNVAHPITKWMAFVSIFNTVVGTGVLALPIAFYYAGIVMASILLLLCTFMIMHGMQLLIYSMVECSRRMEVPYANFPEAMVYSFGQGPGCFRYCSKAGGFLVDGVLAFYHYGICVVYVVFVSSNFKQIIDFYWQEWDLRIYMAAVGVLMIPLFLIQSLKWLVPVNIMGTVLIYCGFIMMFYYLFRGLPSLSERNIFFGQLDNMGLFFGIALFAVSSVGVMLAVEAKMAKPKSYLGWFGVLDVSIFVVMLLYLLFGFFGYWRYGEHLASSISLNLPTKEIAAQVSKIFIALDIIFTYPMSGYVVIDIIMTHYWNKRGELKHAKLKETLVRVLFVIVSTVNAVLAPNLGPLLSLVGALTVSLLNLIFPALMEICLYYPPEYSYGRLKWKLWKDIFLVVAGTIILIEGTFFAIQSMIKDYGHHNSQVKSLFYQNYCVDNSSSCSFIIEY